MISYGVLTSYVKTSLINYDLAAIGGKITFSDSFLGVAISSLMCTSDSPDHISSASLPASSGFGAGLSLFK
jgi:hypothetical protein